MPPPTSISLVPGEAGQRLAFAGAELDDDAATLAARRIHVESTLMLVIRGGAAKRKAEAEAAAAEPEP